MDLHAGCHSMLFLQQEQDINQAQDGCKPSYEAALRCNRAEGPARPEMSLLPYLFGRGLAKTILGLAWERRQRSRNPQKSYVTLEKTIQIL